LIGLDPVEILLNIANEIFLEISYYEYRKNHAWKHNLSVGEHMSYDSSTIVITPISSLEDIRYLIWNVSKKYFYEVEKHFQIMNVDNPIIMHFDKKTTEYRENRLMEKLGKKKLQKFSKLELGFTSSELKQYQTLFLKVLVYRLKMCKILRNLVIYEKKRLNESYFVWYKKYLELTKSNEYYEHFIEPNEFKRLTDI
jgi:hypothetical protein